MKRRRIPGAKTWKTTLLWLRSRLAKRVMILGYHRVASSSFDPFNMSVNPNNFAAHLAILKRHTNIIPLEKIGDWLESDDKHRHAAVITFDDGYADILYRAQPLLSQYQLPATVFVTTGNLGQPFWWDKLAYWFTPEKTPSRAITVQGVRYLSENNADLCSKIYQRLLNLSSPQRALAIAELCDQLGDARTAVRTMDDAEIKRLATVRDIEIGAHSVTHPQLHKLEPQDQWRELADSHQSLCHLLQRPISSMSYPNGSANRTTYQLVTRAGFTMACHSQAGFVRKHSDLLALPRFWVPNVSGKQFARWLAFWL